MKYFLYARKSTESEDKQMLSIEAQLAELREFASNEGLTITEVFTESRTAKEPGRPVFSTMLRRIEKGEATGVIAWHPDRLARNSIDGGRIIYLVDTGKIEDMRFPTYRFDNSAYGKFILNMTFGQSKYYIDNLSENVRRGIRQKLRRGEWPGWAPVGYLNDLRTHTVVLDSEKHRKVKKLFDLYATGRYSLRRLVDMARKIGLTGKRNRPISVHIIGSMLENPFYFGVFRYRGELFEASHPPIISKQLFDRVQEIIQRRSNKTRERTYNFVFRGFMRCGECSGMITAEMKKGKYIYYHCTKRIRRCSQRFIREENLAGQIALRLGKIGLNDITANKILEDLESHANKEERNASSQKEHLNIKMGDVENRIDRLLDGYLSAMIDADEYRRKKNHLLAEKIDLKEKLGEIERGKTKWLELAKDIILTCNDAEKAVRGGDFGGLAEISRKAGSNFILKDRILSFSLREPYGSIFRILSTGEGRARGTAEGGPETTDKVFQQNTLCREWRE